jgi:hypothetical protein
MGEFNAVLHDATTTPSVREIIGWFMANAEQADFAIANVRLAAIDLRPAEHSSLRCRFLLSRLNAEFSADAALLTRDARRTGLENLRGALDGCTALESGLLYLSRARADERSGHAARCELLPAGADAIGRADLRAA